MRSFKELTDKILEFWWRVSPVSATFEGIHKYDHELGKYEKDFLMEVNEKEKDYLRQLKDIEQTPLTDDEKLDYTILTSTIEEGIKEFEEIRMWEKSPGTYSSAGLYGIFILAIRNFAPVKERMASILARLKQVPRVIEEGKKNLKNSPEIYTKVAIEEIQGGIGFFNGFIPKFAEQVPEMKDEVIKASTVAGEAFENYLKFLKEEYLAQSRGEFAIGKGLFDYKLKAGHMLDWNSDDLLSIGEETLNNVKAELNKIAQEIDPTKNWVDIVEDLKSQHPKAEELSEYYRQEMTRARDFVIEKDIVAIPPEAGLEMIDTPEFERPTIPYAAYMPPAPFEKEQKGFFYVTPTDKEEQLRGHSIYSIPIVALHEGYPGHHLQLLRANRVDSKVRKVYGTTVFIEGWALYCEELLYDLGYYKDPRMRLMQLKDELWRACRVTIDVKLHTKQMSYEEAVNFLVDVAKLQKVNAEAEVKRYTSTPTQPMSYVIGKKQVMELKKEYKGSLKEFHDKLLSFGSIPVKLIRERI